MTGKITKLVRSFGSSWGRIQPAGETREIYFNASTLLDPDDFAVAALDQEVEFDEERDLANGSHAVRVRLVASKASAT